MKPPQCRSLATAPRRDRACDRRSSRRSGGSRRRSCTPPAQSSVQITDEGMWLVRSTAAILPHVGRAEDGVVPRREGPRRRHRRAAHRSRVRAPMHVERRRAVEQMQSDSVPSHASTRQASSRSEHMREHAAARGVGAHAVAAAGDEERHRKIALMARAAHEPIGRRVVGVDLADALLASPRAARSGRADRRRRSGRRSRGSARSAAAKRGGGAILRRIQQLHLDHSVVHADAPAAAAKAEGHAVWPSAPARSATALPASRCSSRRG